MHLRRKERKIIALFFFAGILVLLWNIMGIAIYSEGDVLMNYVVTVVDYSVLSFILWVLVNALAPTHDRMDLFFYRDLADNILIGGVMSSFLTLIPPTLKLRSEVGLLVARS